MLPVNHLVDDYEVVHKTYDRSQPLKILEVVSHDPEQITVHISSNKYGDVYLQLDASTGVALRCDYMDDPPRIRTKASTLPVTRFQVIVGRQDWAKDAWAVVNIFDEVEPAKELVKEHNKKAQETDSSFRSAIRKVTEALPVYDYEGWATFRFGSGEWTPPPWADQSWIREDLEYHHTHMSKENPGRVLFWLSKTDAQNDAVHSLTAGSYLKTYYSDVLTEKQIEEWVLLADPPGELEFTESDPEQIYDAYVIRNSGTSLGSCMSYDDDSGVWVTGSNPVRVYGAGDLCVAKLIRNGQQVARALVWPEKKAAGRRYGDTGRLEQALKAAGYEFDAVENNIDARGKGLFEGARLLKIPYGSNNYHMPYVDYGYKIEDAGEYFQLTKDSSCPYAWTTNGLMDEDDYDEYTCDHCGDGCGDTYSVDGESWCYTCYVEGATRCDCCRDRTQYTQTVTTGDSRSRDWCSRCYEDTTICDYCEEPTDDAVIQTVDNTGRDICPTCANNLYEIEIIDGVPHEVDQENEDA